MPCLQVVRRLPGRDVTQIPSADSNCRARPCRAHGGFPMRRATVRNSHGGGMRRFMAQHARVVLACALIIVGQAAARANGAPAYYWQSDNGGPVRLARFSYVSGSVAWSPGGGADWTEAGFNMPVRQGAQFDVPDGSRSEIQFDDGARFRLGGGADASLVTLYSDQDGEF